MGTDVFGSENSSMRSLFGSSIRVLRKIAFAINNGIYKLMDESANNQKEKEEEIKTNHKAQFELEQTIKWSYLMSSIKVVDTFLSMVDPGLGDVIGGGMISGVTIFESTLTNKAIPTTQISKFPDGVFNALKSQFKSMMTESREKLIDIDEKIHVFNDYMKKFKIIYTNLEWLGIIRNKLTTLSDNEFKSLFILERYPNFVTRLEL